MRALAAAFSARPRHGLSRLRLLHRTAATVVKQSDKSALVATEVRIAFANVSTQQGRAGARIHARSRHNRAGRRNPSRTRWDDAQSRGSEAQSSPPYGKGRRLTSASFRSSFLGWHFFLTLRVPLLSAVLLFAALFGIQGEKQSFFFRKVLDNEFGIAVDEVLKLRGRQN